MKDADGALILDCRGMSREAALGAVEALARNKRGVTGAHRIDGNDTCIPYDNGAPFVRLTGLADK